MTHWIIIDGYNLLHAWTPPNGPGQLDPLRDRMNERLMASFRSQCTHMTVVFDGNRAGPGDMACPDQFEICFTGKGESADAHIEALAYRAKKPSSLTVVSSDFGLQDTVQIRGCRTLPCSTFITTWEAAETRHRRQRETDHKTQRKRLGPFGRLGDLFPDDLK